MSFCACLMVISHTDRADYVASTALLIALCGGGDGYAHLLIQEAKAVCNSLRYLESQVFPGKTVLWITD